MPIAPPVNPPAPLSYRVYDIVKDALIEIGAVAPGEDPGPDEAQWAFRKFNDLVDTWQAKQAYVWSYAFSIFTLTPNLNPHTIGNGGTFNTTQPPTAIEAATLNIGGTPNIFTPIQMRDDEWYAQQRIPGLATAIPTDLYYSSDWPLGNCYFWPVPTTAYGVRLWMKIVLSGLTLASTFNLPPGYQQALRLTIAEMSAPHLGLEVSPQTMNRARNARELVWGNNDVIPNAVTRDGGVPGNGLDWFNYRTGMIE